MTPLPLLAGLEPHVLSLAEWKMRANAGDDLSEYATRKQYVAEFKAVEGDERAVATTISTDVRDRDSDTIKASGWDLKNYRKNPVVLWAHDYRSLPIARSPSIKAGDGKLETVDHFVEESIYPLAETILQMVKHRYINAKSVGFNPSDWEVNEDEGGFDFKKQELLEHSYVPVPSNPEALVQARALGINLLPLKDWCEAMLDNWAKEQGIWVRRSQIEEMIKLLGTAVAVPVVDNVDPADGDDVPQGRGFAAIDVGKGVISYNSAHAGGTPLAARDESWDGPGERAAAEVNDLKVMSSWFGGDGDNKGDYKLHHHKAAGGHSLVFRGVTAAAGRLPAADVPTADVAGIRSHLGRHYREFDEVAPWDRSAACWGAYERGCHAMNAERQLDDATRSVLLVALGFVNESAALILEAADGAPEPDVAREIEDVLLSLAEPIKQTIVEGVSDEEMRGILTEALAGTIDEAARTALAARTGRLD